MAKKITRGITEIKEINKQDFDTNNVNDLLSDGQYNYIHRKKGKSEEYHNLTDNIKTISSDNTDLLTVTNNNKTNNTATLRPKHDSQKEQVLASENNTINITHGANDSNETTKIDVNTHKVLTHNNLLSSSSLLTVEHQEGQDTTTLKVTKLEQQYNYIERQKQNTEHYYICYDHISGTMTLKKLENEIALSDRTVKAILDYSFFVEFVEEQELKTVEPPFKNMINSQPSDLSPQEKGVYTDATNPSIFSSNYKMYFDGTIYNDGQVYYDNQGIYFVFDGERITIGRDKLKVTDGKIYNVSGKMLLVEKTGGGAS